MHGGWYAVDDGVVGFFYLMPFESAVQGACCVAIGAEEKDASGGAVDAVDVVNARVDLIAEDFHRNEIVFLGFIGGVDEVTGGFIDGDQPVVTVKNM